MPATIMVNAGQKFVWVNPGNESSVLNAGGRHATAEELKRANAGEKYATPQPKSGVRTGGLDLDADVPRGKAGASDAPPRRKGDYVSPGPSGAIVTPPAVDGGGTTSPRPVHPERLAQYARTPEPPPHGYDVADPNDPSSKVIVDKAVEKEKAAARKLQEEQAKEANKPVPEVKLEDTLGAKVAKQHADEDHHGRPKHKGK